METLTSDPNADWTTAHSGAGGVHTSNGDFAFIPDTTDGFHTYGALWTPTDIVWYVDGVEVFHTATPADMNKPMYMIANLALGGWGGAIDNGDLPAHMTIDYIRAYDLGAGTSTGGGSTGDGSTPSAPSSPGVVLTASAPGATLTGGLGDDTINASQGADHLTGGAGADSFAFAAMPWSAGHITDFQLGVDKLDLSALYNYTGSDPVAGGYVTFVSDGAGGTKVMLDPDGAAPGQPWPFTIVTLDGISPTGLTAAQVFAGQPAAPASPPPPPPPPVVAGVVLTSSAPGATLTGGAGADTLNASQGADHLTGGAGADTFAFAAMPWSAGHITDFQPGVDKLDLSALYTSGYTGTDPVADGYVTFVSDGLGGTKVMLDPDGTNPAQPWPFTIVTLDGVSPTGLTAAQVFNGEPAAAVSPPPPPPPPSAPAGVVLTSPAPGSTLTGGAGADTLNASQGSDTLSGGAGADHFVFGALPWNAGHITDFEHGVDVLDLRPLFAAAGYHGSDPIADGYVKFLSDGNGGTTVTFDSDGPGNANPWPITITTLDHVAPSSLTSADWLFH
jgi:hypothetical protein